MTHRASPGGGGSHDGPNCFAAGTLVVMADGTAKAIEDVRPGDRVLSRDQNADDRAPTESGTVERTFVHASEGTLLLKFGDGFSVHTTEGHPFYVHGQGFTPAGELEVGDAIAEASKELDRVSAIVRIQAARTVYNFEVRGDHTYFVKAGDAWLWVHNTCPNPGGRGGGPAHRGTITQTRKDLESGGYDHIAGDHIPEQTIPTPNGPKSSRSPDLTMTDPNGDTVYVQVGRRNKNGWPVAREVDAAGDIVDATGHPVIFVPYD